MSIYDLEAVKKTFICTKHQDNRLKAYCRLKKISASMLFRLFIDELRITQMDEPIRRKVQEINFNIDGLLGNDLERPYKECFNDNRGNKKGFWFTKKFF